MGQKTRSQGISFTEEMWSQVEIRRGELKCGRSRYFQMLVELDLKTRPEIHPHKIDGTWRLYPEEPATAQGHQALRAAEAGSAGLGYGPGGADHPKRKGR